MDKYTLKIGIFTYLILAIFSLVFYLERTAFLDISFHLFYILKDGEFAIQNYRFGAFLTQLFPLVGSKIGLPLHTIMKLYSVGFVLYYFIIFLVISVFLKSHKFGLILLLFSTLMVTDTFYWIQSEFPQGLAFMLLYFAVLFSIHNNRKYKQWLLFPVLAMMIVTIAFFHPLLIFPFLFCSIFLYIDHDSLRAYFKGGFLLYVFILVIKSLFFKTTYDSTAMSGVKNFMTFFPDYLSLASNKQFLSEVINKYYVLVLLFLGMTFWYIKTRKFIKAFLVTAFFGGYLLLVNVSYPQGADSFYLENLYLPLSIFVIIPFVLDVKMDIKKYYVLLIMMVLGLRLVHIGLNHDLYTERVNLLKGYMHETKDLSQKKIVISEDNFPKDTLLMSWATPYEFWLLSTLSDGESRSIMITDNMSDVEWTKDYNNKFVTKWGAFDYSELSGRYFIFNDTTFYQFKD